jgi:hypothetical protein
MRCQVPRNTTQERKKSLVVASLAVGLSLAVFGLAACGGTTNTTVNGQATTSTTKAAIVDAHPKGESAAKAPMKISYGTGSIGAADPTTTLPNEAGQTIEPGLSPGQNIIIKGGRALPQTLEASYGTPVVWYNLSGRPQRIIFNDYKYYPVDSGTIPPGATFTWTAPSGGPVAYTLEPSGFIGKVFLNPNSGGPGAGFGNSGGT